MRDPPGRPNLGGLNGQIRFWLVVSTPEKYESIGMIVSNIWKHKSHVPNHQPGFALQDLDDLDDEGTPTSGNLHIDKHC